MSEALSGDRARKTIEEAKPLFEARDGVGGMPYLELGKHIPAHIREQVIEIMLNPKQDPEIEELKKTTGATMPEFSEDDVLITFSESESQPLVDYLNKNAIKRTLH